LEDRNTDDTDWADENGFFPICRKFYSMNKKTFELNNVGFQ